MEQPTVNSLLTIATNALAVGIIVEVVKRAGGWSAAMSDRFAPALAVGLGVVIAAAAAAYGGTDIPSAALVGLFGGATASGLYSLKNTAP